jgi:hypothetical protein
LWADEFHQVGASADRMDPTRLTLPDVRAQARLVGDDLHELLVWTGPRNDLAHGDEGLPAHGSGCFDRSTEVLVVVTSSRLVSHNREYRGVVEEDVDPSHHLHGSRGEALDLAPPTEIRDGELDTRLEALADLGDRRDQLGLVPARRSIEAQVWAAVERIVLKYRPVEAAGGRGGKAVIVDEPTLCTRRCGERFSVAFRPRGEVARRRAPDDVRLGGRGRALRGDDGAAGPAAGRGRALGAAGRAGRR